MSAPWIRKSTFSRMVPPPCKRPTLPAELIHRINPLVAKEVIEEALLLSDPVIDLVSPIENPPSVIVPPTSSSILSNLLNKKPHPSCKRKLNFSEGTSTASLGQSSPLAVKPLPPSSNNFIDTIVTSDTSIEPSPVKTKQLKLKNCQHFKCTYVFRKGEKKGTQCYRYSMGDTKRCCYHKEKSASTSSVPFKKPIQCTAFTSSTSIIPVSNIASTSYASKEFPEKIRPPSIKINQLFCNKNYKVVGKINEFIITIQTEGGSKFLVRLPKYMRRNNYLNHYLWRSPTTGVTSWRTR